MQAPLCTPLRAGPGAAVGLVGEVAALGSLIPQGAWGTGHHSTAAASTDGVVEAREGGGRGVEAVGGALQRM